MTVIFSVSVYRSSDHLFVYIFGCISVCFLVCWTPFFSCNTLDALSMKFNLNTSPGEFAFFATTLLGTGSNFHRQHIYLWCNHPCMRNDGLHAHADNSTRGLYDSALCFLALLMWPDWSMSGQNCGYVPMIIFWNLRHFCILDNSHWHTPSCSDWVLCMCIKSIIPHTRMIA